MVFFRRIRGPLVRGSSPGEVFLRFMLLLAVFAACGWLFWMNSKQAMERLTAAGAVVDDTGVLTEDQRRALARFARMFDEELGLELKLRIAEGPVAIPDLEAKTLFFGLDLAAGEALVVFPPLVEKALGDAFRRRLEREFLPPYLEEGVHGEWPKGLVLAIAAVWDALLGVESAPTPIPIPEAPPDASLPTPEETPAP